MRTAAIDTLVALQHPGRFERGARGAEARRPSVDSHRGVGASRRAGSRSRRRRESTPQHAAPAHRRRGGHLPRSARRDSRTARASCCRSSERRTSASYREDFDPRVRVAATTALAKLIKTDVAPSRVIRYRYPYQPEPEARRSSERDDHHGGRRGDRARAVASGSAGDGRQVRRAGASRLLQRADLPPRRARTS